MQNLVDIEEKVFFECQNILESLSKITNRDELLLKQDLLNELTERVAFLKVLDKNKDSLLSKTQQETQLINETELYENEMFIDESEALDTDNQELEEVIFNNELNEINSEESEEIAVETSEISNETHEVFEEAVVDNQPEIPAESFENSKEIYEESINDLDDELPVAELMKEDGDDENLSISDEIKVETDIKSEDLPNRGKIVDYEKTDPKPSEKTVYLESEPKAPEDKKISLTQIKGMKMIESLFDDDPLERVNPHHPILEKPLVEAKTTVEEVKTIATKKKIEFRLDMNDKIAFSKFLFDGSQSEMNETISILNGFDTLEQAKEYLSDLYYDKKWDKVDDYAQRLWTLVENKFL